jgi:hypothetical protein
VLRFDGPKANVNEGTGDAGFAFDCVRENWQARPAGTSPVVAMASALAVGAQRA